MTALLVALATAVAPGPPVAVLRSHGDRLPAALVSWCWRYPPEDDGSTVAICADGIMPPNTRPLAVTRDGRLRIDMGAAVKSVHARLRGRQHRLRMRPVGDSKRRFRARLPGDLRNGAVLYLSARYPQGDAFYGARLRVR